MTVRVRVAVLAERWESASDAGWYARQVAGALGCVADVHVVTPTGETSATTSDGVFTVHELGFHDCTRALVRRDLLLAALAGPTVELDPFATDLLDEGVVGPWEAAVAVLDGLAPDLAVVVGRRALGAVEALRSSRHPLSYALVPADTAFGPLGTDHFDPVLQGASAVLTATTEERAGIVSCGADPERVHWIGPHVAADHSVRREPNTWVGDTGAIVVVTSAPASDRSPGDDGSKLPSEPCTGTTSSVPEVDDTARLAHVLRLANPDPPVAVVATDALTVWHRGRASHGWAVSRPNDFARLAAWAGMVVDLAPEPFLARRCLTALAYGTPVVVPAGTVAAAHAAHGGGLWFDSPAELVWTVQALLDDATRTMLGAQGSAYTAAHYGSTDAFVDDVIRVVLACMPGRTDLGSGVA